MFKTYHFNRFLPLFLFILIPLHAMETNSSKEILTQFFDAIKLCDVDTVRTILKNNPTIIHEVSPLGTTALEEAIHIDVDSFQANKDRPELVELLLKSGAHIESTCLTLLTNIQGHKTCKNQIAHLLFSFGAVMDSDDDEYYIDDLESILRIWKHEDRFKQINNKELIEITYAHIHTRLYKAIKNGDSNKVYNLAQKYTLNINNPLLCYDILLNYDTPYAIADFLQDICLKKRPLDYAIECNQDAIAHLLVYELGADQDPAINDNKQNNYTCLTFTDKNFEETNYLDCIYLDETLEEIKESRVEKTKNDYIYLVFPEETNPINWTYTHQNSEQMDLLEWTFADESSEKTEDCIGTNASLLEKNPSQQSEPVIDHKQPISTINNNANNVMPWKLISCGVAVTVIVVVTKKLYNWWYTKAEQEEDNEQQNEQQPVADVLA